MDRQLRRIPVSVMPFGDKNNETHFAVGIFQDNVVTVEDCRDADRELDEGKVPTNAGTETRRP